MEMMRSRIVDEELIDHRNRTSLGLPPPEIETRLYLKFGGSIVDPSGAHHCPHLILSFSSTTLNAIPSLAYEEVDPDVQRSSSQLKRRGR